MSFTISLESREGYVHIAKIVKRKPAACACAAKPARVHTIDWSRHKRELAMAAKERRKMLKEARAAARGAR